MQPIRRSTSQHSTIICAANQDTAEHSAAYVKPIRSEKIKQWRRDRPRPDAIVLRAAPASIVEYQLKKLFDLIGLFNADTWLPVRDSQNEYTLRALQLYEFHTVR